MQVSWARETASVFPGGYNQELGLGMDQVPFQKNPSTSQASTSFRWAYFPIGPFFPEARQTGFFGHTSSPAPATIQYQSGMGGALTLLVDHCCNLGVRLQLPGEAKRLLLPSLSNSVSSFL